MRLYITSCASLKFRVLPPEMPDSFEFVFAGRPRQTSLLQTEIPELLKTGIFDGEMRP